MFKLGEIVECINGGFYTIIDINKLCKTCTVVPFSLEKLSPILLTYSDSELSLFKHLTKKTTFHSYNFSPIKRLGHQYDNFSVSFGRI